MKNSSGENTLFSAGTFLWWGDNPQKPEMCLVLETGKTGFKVIMLRNIAVLGNRQYEDTSFVTATEEEIVEYWASGQVQDKYYVYDVLLEYGVEPRVNASLVIE